MSPKASKSCPKSNKSPNLVTLVGATRESFYGGSILVLARKVSVGGLCALNFDEKFLAVEITFLCLEITTPTTSSSIVERSMARMERFRSAKVFATLNLNGIAYCSFTIAITLQRRTKFV